MFSQTWFYSPCAVHFLFIFLFKLINKVFCYLACVITTSLHNSISIRKVWKIFFRHSYIYRYRMWQITFKFFLFKSDYITLTTFIYMQTLFMTSHIKLFPLIYSNSWCILMQTFLSYKFSLKFVNLFLHRSNYLLMHD